MINFTHWKRAGLHLLPGFATSEEIEALVEHGVRLSCSLRSVYL
jgi:2-keto-3-deoxy-6-phosphogluconate aldolase